MNIAHRNIEQGREKFRPAFFQPLTLAGCGIVSIALLCGVVRADDKAEPTPSGATETTPAVPADATPADAVPSTPASVDKAGSVTAVEVEPVVPAQPVVPAPAEQPATPAVTPAPSAPRTIEVPAATPSTPDAKTEPVAAAVPATRPAAVAIIDKGLDEQGNISLMNGKSLVVTTRVPFKRINVGQPDVADATIVGPAEILITAKKAGATELVLWDADGHSQVVDVVVRFDLRNLESQLKSMFPRAAVTAESANGSIVLRGHVPDLQTAQQITSVAGPYGPSVLNFLEVSGGQQVVLQVRFAEVSRSISQGLGFNAFATDGKFKFGINEGPGASPPGSLATTSTVNVDPTIPFYQAAGVGSTQFEAFVSALRSNSLLRVLAEPNLTAISGQTASFLAGGEFPVPVPQAGGGGSAITIEYKQYGIQLNFTPTVLGDGRIRLQCSPQVSDLDYTNSVTLNGFIVPGLTTRTVNTTVELAEGQTFALAGLLNNRVVASKNVTPLLGDIPVLGLLFRSVKYQHSDTELVVLVTPRLVEPMNPGRVPRLPGDPWRDPTEAELFFNTDLGGPAPDMRHAPTVRTSHFYGPSGFRPAPSATTAPQK